MGMARQFAIEEHSASGPEGRVRQAPEGGGAGVPDAHRVLIAAQLLRGDVATALAGARQVADPTGRHDAVDLLVDVALEHGRGQLARSVLAEVEATIPASHAAQLKARIAVADGDLHAAKAILVMAIEADPDAAPLRTLLAEVMVAGGTAADARAVLAVLGQAPVNPPHPDAEHDADASRGMAGKRTG